MISLNSPYFNTGRGLSKAVPAKGYLVTGIALDGSILQQNIIAPDRTEARKKFVARFGEFCRIRTKESRWV